MWNSFSSISLGKTQIHPIDPGDPLFSGHGIITLLGNTNGIS
jgi:hypothetical protein